MRRAQIRGQASEKRACVSFRITPIFLAHKRPTVILICGAHVASLTYKHADIFGLVAMDPVINAR